MCIKFLKQEQMGAYQEKWYNHFFNFRYSFWKDKEYFYYDVIWDHIILILKYFFNVTKQITQIYSVF